MKKEFGIAGMSCNHCRKSVEEALNTVSGVSAAVTLSPAVATIEFANGEVALDQLQKAINDKAGDEYIISPIS